MARGPERGLPRRSCSGCATTCARTGSARWCSGCPAGSTPRSSRSLAVDALGPEAVRGARDAVAVLVAREPRGRAGGRRRGLGIRLDVLQIDGVFAAYLRRARASRSAAPQPGVAEENLQARIRGNLLMALSNRVRLAGARDRQQERVRGGLLDAVRRHGRRVRADQGRPEDARVRARRAGGTRRAGEARPIPAADPRQAAVGGAAARTRRTRTRSRPTRCSTRSSRRTSRTTARPRTSSPAAAWTPTLVERVVGDDRPRRVQAPAGRARASRSRRRRSGATGGCRSRTATGVTATRRLRRQGPVAQPGQSRGLLTLVSRVRILPGPPREHRGPEAQAPVSRGARFSRSPGRGATGRGRPSARARRVLEDESASGDQIFDRLRDEYL